MINKILKNKYIDYVVILVITCFYLFSYSKFYMLVGSDLPFHLNRIVGVAKSFEEGQILPKLYAYHNNGFGYAAPLFYCDLFLYPFGLLYHFGVSAVICYKLCVFFYTLIGNIIIYKMIKKETNNRALSIISILLYIGANYHIQTMFDRAGLSEVIAFTFIPLVLHSIYKILIKHENAWVYLGVSFSLLVLSHLLTTVLYGIFFFVMIVVFIVMNFKDKKLIKNTLLTILKGTILACFLTAWFLLPMFEQFYSQEFWIKETGKTFDISTTVQSITSLFEVFAVTDQTTFYLTKQASCGLLLLVLTIIGLLIKKNKYIITLFVFCVFVYLILFGVIPGSFLNVIQYLFRWYSILFSLMTIIGIYGLYNLNNKNIKTILYVVISIFFVVNVYIANNQATSNSLLHVNNDAPEEYISHITNNSDNVDYNYDELGQAEYLPLCYYIDYNTFSTSIKYNDEELGLVDYIYEGDYDRWFSSITFTCDNVSDLELVLPLSFYKGYAAYELIDGQWVKFEALNQPTYKLVAMEAKEGVHTYMIKYAGTKLQYISLVLSSLSWLGVCIYYVTQKKKAPKMD